MIELRESGARDAFGHLFRDWHVVGWEEGRVPEGYVCWLKREPESTPVDATKQQSPQMELFA